MTKKFLFCHQQKKKCPFRILDFQLDVYICEFYKEFWGVFNDGNSFGAKTLLSRTCEWIKAEEARHDFISKNAKKKTIKMLKTIAIGDEMFWTTHSEDVLVFERPTEDTQIARIKCQRTNGKIVEIPAYLLRKLSKGNYSDEYYIEGTSNIEKTKELENKAKSYGFRTEIEKKDNGYLLKVYGDSQQDVDDFIHLSLENDFDISPYI